MKGLTNHAGYLASYLPCRTLLAAPTAFSSLTYLGGPVLQTPELVSLYWGYFGLQEVEAMQSYLTQFAAYLSGQGAPAGFVPVLSQYNVTGATVGASLWYGLYHNFLLQAPTPIDAADGAANFQWVAGDFNRDGVVDLIGVKVTNTGTGTVEVHVLDGASNFQNFLLQTGTPIDAADGAANFQWVAGDFNRDGVVDLLGIKVTNTGTGSVEVHVLDGAG